MSTQDPSGSPRKLSYVFCALPDRRTPNSSRCNDRFHDPSRCPTCPRWIAPIWVAARYSDVAVVVVVVVVVDDDGGDNGDVDDDDDDDDEEEEKKEEEEEERKREDQGKESKETPPSDR